MMVTICITFIVDKVLSVLFRSQNCAIISLKGPPRYSGFSEIKELSSKSLKIQNKVYYLDVKENKRGKFVKITEVMLVVADEFRCDSKQILFYWYIFQSFVQQINCIELLILSRSLVFDEEVSTMAPLLSVLPEITDWDLCIFVLLTY